MSRAGWEEWRPGVRPHDARSAAASAGPLPMTPFTRLARVHTLVMGGDAAVAIALAGSLFFSISPEQGREQVLRYLLLTMAPFAVIAPLLGPAIDRVAGGRRLMVVACAAGRIVASLLMMFHLDSLLLFPEALAFLVLSKAHGVAKAALVPSVVSDERELVEANSKLNVLAGISAFAFGIPAGGLGALAPELTLAFAACVFAAGTIAALKLPPTRVALGRPTQAETAELHSAGVILAATAMALLRACVGFFTFHLAFWFRRTDAPTVWFGVAVVFSAVGSLAGSAVAPSLRRVVKEERILVGVLAFTAVGGLVTALVASRMAAAVLALVLGASASAGKLAFDSIVQRDAPDANQGRAFARFETRFQLAWVLAGLLPVAINLPGWSGFLLVGAGAAVAAVTYVLSSHEVRRTGVAPTPLSQRLREEVRRRRAEAATRPPSNLPPPAPGVRPSATEPPQAMTREPEGPVSVARSVFRRRGR